MIGFDPRVDILGNPAEAKASPYGVGELIDGKYRVQGVLGEGSFGWVFMAAHAQIQALTYAVKVLKAEHTSDAETVARFHREAETVASLRSKHSVRVTDYGVDGHLPYIVMEFVDGLSIGEMLSRGGPFPETDVLELSLDVLRALDEAHRLGIVHRDLKPDNVIVVADPDTLRPVARVLDFGLAKILEPENFQVRPEATAAGLVLCTARYASPDLLKGSPSAQSDIYALGISMIEMLDGRPPYGGEDFYTVAAKHIAPEPVPMGEAAEGSVLSEFIKTCTEKKLELRYASAADAIEDLLDIQKRLRRARGTGYSETVSASVMARFSSPVPTRPIVRQRSKRRRLAVLGFAALFALITAAALLATRSGPESEPSASVEPGNAAEVPVSPPSPAQAQEASELSGQALSLAEAQGRITARETRTVANSTAQSIAAALAAEAEADRDSRRDRRRDSERDEPEEDENPSTSETESGTDEDLFGGIRTIGGQ